jgi:hypothetical protein
MLKRMAPHLTAADLERSTNNDEAANRSDRTS